MNDLFLKACRRETVVRPPVWIMRQAGRYLPEYRALRERHGFLTLCRTPELAAEVTLQPVDRFGMDAAILFSDILVLADCLGFEVRFEPGPVLDTPVRTEADVRRLPLHDPEERVPFVFETVRILRRALEGRVPLIGFAAAPFTLASYLVEGAGSKSFVGIKRMLYGEPGSAHALLDKIATATERYLLAQVRAGAQAIQLFDTWAGLLAAAEYREFDLPYTRRVLDALRATGVPLIYFALDASHLLEEFRSYPADVIGVDWRIPLDRASQRLGGRFVLQGNLDPCALLAPAAVVEKRTREILKQAEGIPGHVFNLGHGVLPDTSIEGVETLLKTVRTYDSRA